MALQIKRKIMDSWVIAMMLGASIFLGAIALVAFLWGIKNGQFDDETKMMNQVQYDDEAELNDAANQQRKQEALKKEYKPE
jgi:cbb3-type cytochrome oxidase maturation protein